MERQPEHREPTSDQTEATEEYEAPKVEEVDTEASPAVTAAGGSPYGAITLIEEDE